MNTIYIYINNERIPNISTNNNSWVSIEIPNESTVRLSKLYSKIKIKY